MLLKTKTIIAKLLITFLLIYCSECVLFKKLLMDGAVWPKYIFTTVTGNIQSVMECSGLCGTSGSNCTVFVPDLGSNSCHLGALDNAQVGVLAAQAGISETYVEYGKSSVCILQLFHQLISLLETLTAVLNEQYYKLTAITSEATWQSFIYSTVTLPPGGDILNCPNACQEDNHCEMFVYHVSFALEKIFHASVFQFVSYRKANAILEIQPMILAQSRSHCPTKTFTF